VDEYQYGTVDRISPEAPVLVFKFLYKEERPGMALNVKANLESHNIDVTMLTELPSRKIRLIDKRTKHHILRIDHDQICKEPLSFETLIPTTYDAIVISDYNKGFVTQLLLEEIHTLFDGPIYIDTKKKNLGSIKGCFVKINEIERNECQSVPEETIVTLGSGGAVYKEEVFKSYPVEVSDVCGAGDTFISALVYWHLNTGNIKTAIKMANKAAAITVQHFGTYAPTIEEYYDQA
jgi:D-beta-D-heptose 7-phosphate kinase/D-beta-D-heptose 1-phosphate adenosyltransferase